MKGAAVLAAALDLVYPPLCPVCGVEGLAEGEPLGPTCLEKILWAAERDCLRCGRVLGPHAERDRCLDCRRRTFAFSRGLAAAAYEDPVRALVLRMKIRRESFWARPLARWLAARLGAEALSLDAVVCVPAHWMARMARGFNPAREIARELSGRLGLPFQDGVLSRGWHWRRRQSDLPRAARLANVAGAFSVRSRADLAGKRLLLVDDVMTTGATMDACARVLRISGAVDVVAAAVARS